jgi:hypothetical protein
MRLVVSDGYDLDGTTEPVVTLDIADAVTATGTTFYYIEIVSNTGGDPVSVVVDGFTQTDPLKAAARVQAYPQRFGPFDVSRGNPVLVIGPTGADTGAYSIYALTDESP